LSSVYIELGIAEWVFISQRASPFRFEGNVKDNP